MLVTIQAQCTKWAVTLSSEDSVCMKQGYQHSTLYMYQSVLQMADGTWSASLFHASKLFWLWLWHIQISNQKPPTGRDALAYRRQAGDTTAVGVRSAPPDRVYRPSSRSNYQTSTKPYVISANSPPVPYKKKFWCDWLSIICWLFIFGTTVMWYFLLTECCPALFSLVVEVRLQ